MITSDEAPGVSSARLAVSVRDSMAPEVGRSEGGSNRTSTTNIRNSAMEAPKAQVSASARLIRSGSSSIARPHRIGVGVSPDQQPFPQRHLNRHEDRQERPEQKRQKRRREGEPEVRRQPADRGGALVDRLGPDDGVRPAERQHDPPHRPDEADGRQDRHRNADRPARGGEPAERVVSLGRGDGAPVERDWRGGPPRDGGDYGRDQKDRDVRQHDDHPEGGHDEDQPLFVAPGGALAKSAVKHELDAAGALAFELTAVTTILVLARFLQVLRRSQPAAGSARTGLLAPTAALGLAALVLPWLLWQDWTDPPLDYPLGPLALRDGAWPIALGLAIFAFGFLADPRRARLPAGDIVIFGERTAQDAITASARWLTGGPPVSRSARSQIIHTATAVLAAVEFAETQLLR